MNYPLISEYIEAIKAAEDNFEQLRNLRPVLDEYGEPIMTSGNFAVVFKMKDEQTGKLHAVKCFLKEQEGRAEAYRMIAEELEYVNSTFLTPIKYLDKELFVDSANSEDSEFPVLLMDWVEGQTLDKYIQDLYDKYEISLLAYQFSRLAIWLMPQPFAHGDLKPDNILVKEDGTLVLVDYDGMYVPAMKGQKARELGSPAFRHPSRTKDDFDEHIDDFSLASILLSLKAISLDPALLEEYGASDRLLFSEKDYRNLSESKVMDVLKPLMQDAELASLYSIFILALSQNNLSLVSFRLLYLSRPKNLSTKVKDADLADAWTDEFGVMYSADKNRLLRSPNLEHYEIRKGTIVIADYAFNECESLASITIPESVTTIGFRTFWGCKALTSITIPESVSSIGWNAFSQCHSLTSITIPKDVPSIGLWPFEDCYNLSSIYVEKGNKALDSRNNCNAVIETRTNALIAGCKSSFIPDGVSIIRSNAFRGCRELTSITIPEGVLTISWFAFSGCTSLVSINLPNSLTEIDGSVFDGCYSLSEIIIPNGTKSKFEKLLPEYKDKLVEQNGDENLSTEVTDEDLANAWTDEYGVMYSKDRKRLLEAPWELKKYSIIKNTQTICNCAFVTNDIASIIIPDSVTAIGSSAFDSCTELTSIIIPQNVVTIGAFAFNYCDNLSFVTLQHGVKNIGQNAFYRCVSMTSIVIPGSVEKIGEAAFSRCNNLNSVTILEGVKIIEDGVFARCEKLSSIILPKSITVIGENVFGHCDELKKIYISTGTRLKFERLLPEFKDILVEQNDKEDIFNTEVTDLDIDNGVEDEFGVIYSKDGKRLLKANECVGTYTIKSGTKIICDSAFQDCYELSQIVIPESVKCIGDNPFSSCHSLLNIVCKSKQYIFKNGAIFSSDLKTIVSCISKEKVFNIPNSVLKIANEAFSFCSNLVQVSIPNSVLSIGDYAFSACDSLDQITLPHSIRQIGHGAFYNCCSLTNIIVPSNVTSVKENAFKNCMGLEKVYFHGANVSVNNNAFSNCKALKNIFVPWGSKYWYDDMLYSYKQIIEEPPF